MNLSDTKLLKEASSLLQKVLPSGYKTVVDKLFASLRQCKEVCADPKKSTTNEACRDDDRTTTCDDYMQGKITILGSANEDGKALTKASDAIAKQFSLLLGVEVTSKTVVEKAQQVTDAMNDKSIESKVSQQLKGRASSRAVLMLTFFGFRIIMAVIVMIVYLTSMTQTTQTNVVPIDAPYFRDVLM